MRPPGSEVRCTLAPIHGHPGCCRPSLGATFSGLRWAARPPWGAAWSPLGLTRAVGVTRGTPLSGFPRGNDAPPAPTKGCCGGCSPEQVPGWWHSARQLPGSPCRHSSRAFLKRGLCVCPRRAGGRSCLVSRRPLSCSLAAGCFIASLLASARCAAKLLTKFTRESMTEAPVDEECRDGHWCTAFPCLPASWVLRAPPECSLPSCTPGAPCLPAPPSCTLGAPCSTQVLPAPPECSWLHPGCSLLHPRCSPPHLGVPHSTQGVPPAPSWCSLLCPRCSPPCPGCSPAPLLCPRARSRCTGWVGHPRAAWGQC